MESESFSHGTLTRNRVQSLPISLSASNNMLLTSVAGYSPTSVPVKDKPSSLVPSTVWTWGRAKNYRLGRDVLSQDSFKPEVVYGFEGRAVTAAACGGGHTAVALRDGTLLAFGYSQYGQLGLGDRSDTYHPTPVFLPPSPLSMARKAPDIRHETDFIGSVPFAEATVPISKPSTSSHEIADGYSTEATEEGPTEESPPDSSDFGGTMPDAGIKNVLKHSSRLNLVTITGHLRQDARSSINNAEPFCRVDGDGRLVARVAQVCCGRYHTIARSIDGTVYTWGGGKNGRLGHGDEKIRLVPACVDTLLPKRAVTITAGYHNNLVLTDSGEVWSWGWGAHGQLGLGDTQDRDRPTIIESLSGVGVTGLSCGDRHSFAITASGTVLGWGSNEFGQLGTGRRGDTFLSPTPIPALAGLVVTALACGDRHSAAVTNIGAVYTWGCGTDGQCGHGDFRDVSRPRRLVSLANECVVDVKCGHNFTMAITDLGIVYSWGNNAYGQLGNDGTGKSAFPVRVVCPGGAEVALVACAHFHCVLITKTEEQCASSQNSDLEYVIKQIKELKTEQQYQGPPEDFMTTTALRLTSLLEDYGKRSALCNLDCDKQSREITIADIQQLSSQPT